MFPSSSPRAVSRSRPALALLSLTLLGLSACTSAEVSSISAASKDQIRSIRVSEVNVVIQTGKPSPELQTALKQELEKSMPLCATGQIDHRLDVTITDYEEQDVGKAIFLGDEIELEGRAEFVDLASGSQTGAYFVENSFAWGGLIGAAMMSDAEVSLSKGFAEQICDEVFDVDLVQAKKDAG